MEKNDQYYDREKLYKEIWETTMIALCKQYGITHAVLIEVCKKLDIPRPHVGYWIQKECGKSPPQPELPVFKNPPSLPIHPPNQQDISNRKTVTESNRVVKSGPKKSAPKPKIDTEHVSGSKVQAVDIVPEPVEQADVREVHPPENPLPEPTPAPKVFRWQEHVNEKEILAPEAFEEAGRLIEKEWLPGSAIAAPGMTGKEHPYIKKTRKVLERKKANPGKTASRYNQGLIHSCGKELFDIDVGPASVQRALSILKVLCLEFEKQGFPLISEQDRYYQNRYNPVCVVIMEQKITFSLKEDTTKTEIKNKNMYPEYEYTPTGILTLQHLFRQAGHYEQRLWSDTEQTPLEERLPEVMTGFILAAAWEKENAARETERTRKEAIREEKERLARIEKQRRVNVKKGLEHWVHYQEMVAFLDDVKELCEKSAEKNENTKKWIQWAEKYLSNFQAIPEDMIQYDVDEYHEESTSQRPTYNPPPEEPYNYWKRPWYQRKR
jgi:hypothetical protein